TITCQGFGKVKPGDTLRLHGLGDRFEGDVFVSGISHRVTTGKWLTDIEFGLSPQWFHSKKDISESPASGMLPAVHGLQVGVVRLIEGDPEGEERICVSIPIIDQEDEGVWARLLLSDAGDERGVIFRPEIGDEVMVGFVNDDPRDAIVLGALHSGTKPSPIPASDDNFKKGVVTKSGLSLLFNDEDESIQIKTASGNVMLLSDSERGIELKDQHQNTIKMDGDGIQIDSSKNLTLKAAGDIVVNGMNIDLDASAEMKAQGGASTVLSSSGITDINGSLVKIN
ncbi:phage baseplate assembly protein V, partial [Balneolaceae bacterium ANBcel3]|nr:phage baseplate assembly protein V [Balneolaceae bacterium ANBcel3]